MSQCCEEFVFTWTIENYYLCDKKREELLCSPIFLVNNFHGSQWRVFFYPKGNFYSADFVSFVLFRCWSEHFQAKLTIDFKIELCNVENKVLVFAEKKGIVFEPGSDCSIKNFTLIEELEMKMKDSAKDTLIVRCFMGMQKSARAESAMKYNCFAETEIGFDVFPFAWDAAVNCLSNFSNLSKTKTFTIDEGRQFCINLTGRKDEILFKIRQSREYLSPFLPVKCEIILLCDYGEIELFKKCDFFTFRERTSTWNFPSIHKKSWFKKYNLKHGYLLLKFNFSISNGKLFSKLIDDSKHLNKSPSTKISMNIPTTKFFASELESLLISETHFSGKFEINSILFDESAEEMNDPNLFCSFTTSKDISAIESLTGDLRALMLNKEQADVSFRIESEIISAHKCVLAARSPVFSAMFKLKMVENEIGVIDISDIDVQTLRLFLEFLYTGEMKNLDCETALDLLLTAEQYQVLPLRQKLSQFLKDRLNCDNICDVLLVSDMVGDNKLKVTAIDYMKENAEKILISPKWDEFIDKNTKLCSEIFHEFSKDYS